MAETCRYCFPSKSFATAEELKAHVTNDHKYRCNYCFIHFGSSYTWVSHHDVEHKNRCPYCAAAVIGANRDKHLREVHGYHTCRICSVCYVTEDDLESHYGNPQGLHPFRCNLCRRELMNQRDFWVHCYELHRDKCLLCDAKLKSNINDKVQWEDHLRTTHRLHPCSECFEVFQAEEQFNNHYKTKHRYSCAFCSSYFPNEADRSEHVRLSHRVQCPLCHRLFATQFEFEHHYNDRHRIKCSICHVTCPDEESKLEHENAAHRIQCLLCAEYFAKEMVELHLKMQHRFVCFVCDREFDREIDRGRHTTMVHQNDVASKILQINEQV